MVDATGAASRDETPAASSTARSLPTSRSWPRTPMLRWPGRRRVECPNILGMRHGAAEFREMCSRNCLRHGVSSANSFLAMSAAVPKPTNPATFSVAERGRVPGRLRRRSAINVHPGGCRVRQRLLGHAACRSLNGTSWNCAATRNPSSRNFLRDIGRERQVLRARKAGTIA